ncbi:MAG TPA: M42 family metallopeptidase [Phycisphaerae bacterium]|nr:M42 family metallopeptidase [Phycisphaerae bacterium]HPS53944.1 M42 family metallopeptidase [Phycisphaerae bacterium]
MKSMKAESFKFLESLLTSCSPSGFEASTQKIWCDYVRKFADEVHTDNYGNAVAVLNPGADTKILVDGHIDEVGLMIKYIDDKGFIYFQSIGGVDPALIRSKRVNIHTGKGIVRGVVGATAIHLIPKDQEQKSPKMHELFIDIGAKDAKEAKRKVSLGDPITFVDSFEMLDENIAVSRALDNRIGCWVAAEVLRIASVSRDKLNCTLYACSSIQEETGCNGAQMNVMNVKPDAAIAVDVTHATDTPGIDVKLHGEVKLGGGPTYTVGRENHPVLIDRLKKVAARKKIELQTEIFSKTGGTDAMVMWTKNGGTPSAIVSPPTRYMHSTIEMMDLRDLQKTADWLAAFVIDVKKGEKFKVKV